jgi:hypothetical protein
MGKAQVMKNASISVLIFIIITVLSCKKDETPDTSLLCRITIANAYSLWYTGASDTLSLRPNYIYRGDYVEKIINMGYTNGNFEYSYTADSFVFSGNGYPKERYSFDATGFSGHSSYKYNNNLIVENSYIYCPLGIVQKHSTFEYAYDTKGTLLSSISRKYGDNGCLISNSLFTFDQDNNLALMEVTVRDSVSPSNNSIIGQTKYEFKDYDNSPNLFVNMFWHDDYSFLSHSRNNFGKFIVTSNDGNGTCIDTVNVNRINGNFNFLGHCNSFQGHFEINCN